MADVGDLSAVLEELRDQDIRADLDLSDLRVPGVWIRLRTIEHDSLAGGADTLGIEAIAIVKDQNPARVYAALIGLYEQIKDTLGIPDDTSRLVTVNHPEGGSLPGLAIPYQLVP